jgi:hypothetical protein
MSLHPQDWPQFDPIKFRVLTSQVHALLHFRPNVSQVNVIASNCCPLAGRRCSSPLEHRCRVCEWPKVDFILLIATPTSGGAADGSSRPGRRGGRILSLGRRLFIIRWPFHLSCVHSHLQMPLFFIKKSSHLHISRRQISNGSACSGLKVWLGTNKPKSSRDRGGNFDFSGGVAIDVQAVQRLSLSRTLSGVGAASLTSSVAQWSHIFLSTNHV